MRRASSGAGKEIEGPVEFGELVVDIPAPEAKLSGEEIKVSRKDFDLLAELVRHAGNVVTREDLMADVWDMNWFGSTKALDVHIRALRKKPGDSATESTWIHTVRGVGFRFAQPEMAAVSLRTLLLIAFAYVLMLALIALGLPLALSLKDRVNTEVRSQAHSQAAIVATRASSLIGKGGDPDSLSRLINIAAETVNGRVLVVNSAGKVVSDSGVPGNVGSNYASRPEIAAALKGKSDQRERKSDTLGTEILATADPVIRGNRTVGAVRITQSVDAVHSAVNRSLVGLGLLGLLVIAFALVVAAVIANQIARPVRRLEVTARQFATGGTEAEAEVTRRRQQKSLARSFNEMTARVGRLLRSQRDFVANASTSCALLLTGLRLRLEGLSDELDDDGQRAELDAGMKEVDRLSKMVDELLILSRARSTVPGKCST